MRFKSGYVSIIGKPNVGKSTLLNTILGKKVAIVSDIAGTTRFSITGIKNLPDAQIIFFDTPGIYNPKTELEQRMYSYAYKSIIDANIILFLINVTEGMLKSDLNILDKLKNIATTNEQDLDKIPVFLVLNKIDLLKNNNLVWSIIEKTKTYFRFKEYIDVSAKENLNIDKLLKIIVNYLPQQEKLFENEDAVKLPLRLHISEIIREKLFQNVYEEIPKSTTVITENIKSGDVDKTKLVIEATIIVERDNHKGIIIGENGRKLKQIGSTARKDLESILKRPIYLSLFVKVKEKWTKRNDTLAQLGF